MSKDAARNAVRLIQAAINTAKSLANGKYSKTVSRLENDTLIHLNVEDRDFDAPIVISSNWNNVDHYDATTKTRVDDNDIMSRLCDALERLDGVDIAWSDCTTTCDDCGKLLNNNPEYHGWKPHYVSTDNGDVCEECVVNDPEDYLGSLENDAARALHFDGIDPEEHEYFRIEEEGSLEIGLHPGQNDSPTHIAKKLRALGLSRFFFEVDKTGQFDMHYSVWLHEDERDIWEGLKQDEIAATI